MLAEGMLFTMVAGAYGYIFMAERGSAKKEDLDRVERKVEFLYEHLVRKPMPEVPKNGKK